MIDQVQLLFHALIDLSEEDRESYFQKHEILADLRAEVEQLLRFDDNTNHLLTHSVATCAARMLDVMEGTIEDRRCGPYRLLQSIGHGGMGSVHMAERVDGEVEQRVAIKLLRYGAYDSAFRGRFLQERQILATLSHPAIGRLLDAGHTADGQPYLAMEYIDGIPIDVYSEKLGLRQKLELFLQVCEAVSYAHRHLIVHRDLKASNILVDHEGRPKLLDFGIAKIIDPRQGQEDTSTVLRALTPCYASPEQVRGEAITTASDVYSLGVLLYKLLTGRFPYEFAALTPVCIDRTVCEVEPAPPRISQDVDNILLMALRKEPSRRYTSVQHLADDIGRALSDRPVSARPDTIRYRTAKFIRRNRISFTAAILALAAMVAGSIIAMVQARLAQERFQDVRKLAHTFVFELHDEIAKLEGSTKVRETMVRTGLEYLDHLARNAGGDLGLQREIAAAYLKIGDAEGNPTRPNLGRIGDAVVSYRKAGGIYERLAAKNAAYLGDLAQYYLQYAALVRFNRDLKRARDLSELAIQTLDRMRARRILDAQSKGNYIAAWCTLGDMDEDLGHYRQAWTSFSRCRELARDRLKGKRDLAALTVLAQADERIGTAAQELGHLTEALQALGEDESVLNELLASEPRDPKLHRRRALVDLYRASVFYDDKSPDLGDQARALKSARQYLKRTEEMVRSDPSNTSAQFSRAIALYEVSFCLREFDAEAAVTLARQALKRFDDLIASGKTSYLITSRRMRGLVRLGEAELKAGYVAEALRSAESAIAGERTMANRNSAESEQHVAFVSGLIIAGKANAASGNLERAEKLLREAREEAQLIAKNEELETIIPLANAQEALGAFYAHRRTDQARESYQQLVDLWQHYAEPNEYVHRRKAVAARLLASLH